MCKTTDVKFAVVECAHSTIRDNIYNPFTYENTFRYFDILPKFVSTYNDAVHLMTGMAPSRMTDSDFLAKWKRMDAKR